MTPLLFLSYLCALAVGGFLGGLAFILLRMIYVWFFGPSETRR